MLFTEVKPNKLASGKLADISGGLSCNFYDVKETPFSDKEKAFAAFLIKEIHKSGSLRKNFDGVDDSFTDGFSEEIISEIGVNELIVKLPSKKVFATLAEALVKLLLKVKFVEDKVLFAEYVIHNSVGLKQLAFFSLDEDLEELMVNSPENIFVFHRKYGMCRVNVAVQEEDLENIIQRIALTINREFNVKNPLLDARLPDGSRVNATLGDVSPNGATLTIRKFSATPLTILDLIENKTISSEAAAFLWLMVDGLGNSPMNILIAGGTTSGKTTLLNVLSNFVRLSERIVSIEDTIELSLLGRDNWVPLESRNALGTELGMDSLLKNSLRMRPDRLIVGEVRGPEALTLFTAMDTGHEGCMGTIHANNARETVVKLQERPLSVPEAMLPLLDMIVIIERHFSKEFGMQRRVTQIVELSRMDNKVLFGTLFDFDEKSDSLKQTDISGGLLEEIARKNTLTKNDLKKEIALRKLVLEWMIENKIRKPFEVLEVIDSYYYNPQKVTDMISSSVEKGKK